MNDICFVSDFFANQVNGGGELNNEILINLLSEKGHNVTKIKSHTVNLNFLKQNKDKKLIIANFVNMHPDCREHIQSNCDYVIYEHDH